MLDTVLLDESGAVAAPRHAGAAAHLQEKMVSLAWVSEVRVCVSGLMRAARAVSTVHHCMP